MLTAVAFTFLQIERGRLTAASRPTLPIVRGCGLPALEQGLRGNVNAHGTCFAIHILLAILALFSRHPWFGALWMLLPGVVVHLYPVLLQRSIMLRLQPLLDKSGS